MKKKFFILVFQKRSKGFHLCHSRVTLTAFPPHTPTLSFHSYGNPKYFCFETFFLMWGFPTNTESTATHLIIKLQALRVCAIPAVNAMKSSSHFPILRLSFAQILKFATLRFLCGVRDLVTLLKTIGLKTFNWALCDFIGRNTASQASPFSLVDISAREH